MMRKVWMTEQEVYNHVVRHLQVQGEHAASSMGQCLYRGKNGLRCAVGCLIPATEYDADDIEGGTLGNKGEYLWPAMARLGVKRSQTMEDLLGSLQGAHDSEGNWEGEPLASSLLPLGLTERLRKIAKDFKLKPIF
jgi:hypothetical protein